MWFPVYCSFKPLTLPASNERHILKRWKERERDRGAGFDQRTYVGRYHSNPPSQWTEGGIFLQSILIHHPPPALSLESRFLRTSLGGNFCTSPSPAHSYGNSWGTGIGGT
ncbi:hypothetical protein CEXT_518041 [Caerostris extrusa]|uniref:Uncharacterized protein n=1 Tax=Caerostris extrusa TaxID=172846 RepID=A0AAV4SH06_CAEEX|nr:hypothetical protein CEXT_518041 [Caerostris extrusa]